MRKLILKAWRKLTPWRQRDIIFTIGMAIAINGLFISYIDGLPISWWLANYLVCQAGYLINNWYLYQQERCLNQRFI